MPEESITYRLAKIHLANGYQKEVLLNREEIYNLLAAVINRDASAIYAFYYDGPDKKISGILDLNKVEFIDFDDTEMDACGMELLDYSKFKLLKKPSIFRRAYLKLKWLFEDLKRKVFKNV